ncbi:helix-turn-helix domain-containing protein [Streptococcus urinalis]|uniref:Transcriptional regulator, Fis family n=1 Tax=Streptococcus urinalis 2285-97 TaxID=764291 RepID=G5KHU3_9STRE|nr:helix-turn-helix domain-containing protein [Streptococcus urinalis]EHJ56018.1 transcriptional regulator, Fis family [Streptococcus urinalis 2285-97]
MNNFKWFQNFNQLEKDVKKLIIESPGYYISEYLVTKILNEEIIKYQLHINSEASENTIKNYNSKKTLFDYNQDIIKTVLAENDGNQTKTAKQLGISRTTLWRYLNT